jgi:hypothetical protein
LSAYQVHKKRLTNDKYMSCLKGETFSCKFFCTYQFSQGSWVYHEANFELLFISKGWSPVSMTPAINEKNVESRCFFIFFEILLDWCLHSYNYFYLFSLCGLGKLNCFITGFVVTGDKYRQCCCYRCLISNYWRCRCCRRSLIAGVMKSLKIRENAWSLLSRTLAINTTLQISPRIFEKIWNGPLGFSAGPEKTISW